MPYACGVRCSCAPVDRASCRLAPDSYQLQTKIFACEVCLLSSHICGTARSAFFRSAVRRIAFARRRESSATLTHRAACISLLDTCKRELPFATLELLHISTVVHSTCPKQSGPTVVGIERYYLARVCNMIAQRQACTSLPSSHLWRRARVAPKRVGARRASLLYTRTSRSSLSIPCRPFSSAGWSALCT